MKTFCDTYGMPCHKKCAAKLDCVAEARFKKTPTRLDVFKSFVYDLMLLSKCNDGDVAAIITDAALSQVYSIGVNGGPKGLVDCMCSIDSKYGCVHAEINALVKCTNTDNDKIMIVSLSPCKQCAAAIINAPGKFKAVYYLSEYKDLSGVRLLQEAGISVTRI